VRELGIDRTEAQRAVKIASIAPEAKEAARVAGLNDNQSALLRVSREATPEHQVAKVAEIAAERKKPEPPQQPDLTAEERQRAAESDKRFLKAEKTMRALTDGEFAVVIQAEFSRRPEALAMFTQWAAAVERFGAPAAKWRPPAPSRATARQR
jgi:hypothetical protein